MFPDYLHKDIDELPRISLVAISVALIAVCQLVAMVFVAGGQVDQPGQRDLRRLAQQVSISECAERNTGPTRHGCIQQILVAMDAARNAKIEVPAVKVDMGGGAMHAVFDEHATAGIPVKFATRDLGFSPARR